MEGGNGNRLAATHGSTNRGVAGKGINENIKTWPRTRMISWTHGSHICCLVQLRTGKIGLRHFLLQTLVPEVLVDTCECGLASETARHIAVFCALLHRHRARLVETLRGPIDFTGLISQKGRIRTFVRWFMRTGRLEKYRSWFGQPSEERKLPPPQSARPAWQALGNRIWARPRAPLPFSSPQYRCQDNHHARAALAL